MAGLVNPGVLVIALALIGRILVLARVSASNRMRDYTRQLISPQYVVVVVGSKAASLITHKLADLSQSHTQKEVIQWISKN